MAKLAKTPLYDTILDPFYKEWGEQKEGKWTYDQFVDRMPFVARVVEILCRLDGQVHNGGWYQWWDNGYGKKQGEKAIFYLEKEIGTETAKKVAELTKAIIKAIEETEYDTEEYENVSSARLEGKEDDDESLDSKFYAIAEKFRSDIEEWIRNNYVH